MKNKLAHTKLLYTILAAGFFTLLIITSKNYAVEWWPFGKQTDLSQVPVQINPNPVSAEIKANTSVAPVIKTAAPSVVNVFSTKIIRGSTELQYMPFFHDPFFRYFFGDNFKSSPGWKPKNRNEQSLGSGVIVSGDGYIITNNHVIDGADKIHISLNDNEKEYEAKLIGADPKTDIALLKIDAENLPAITLTDSDHIEVGDFVVAIGNPFGVGQTVTSGIVSAIGRGNIGITDYEDFIQTDASINPGNSGGALIDAEGRLIGINTAILSRSGGNQGIGFAVPTNLVKSVMERILKHGRVVRGFLGVQIQDISTELAEAFNLSDNNGAIIGYVIPGSAAEETGLEKGDVIIEFKGTKVKDTRQLRLMVARTAPETKTRVNVMRDGEKMEFDVILKELPGTEMAGDFYNSQRENDNKLLSGIIIDDLNPQIRRRFNIPSELEGAYVREIKTDAAAFTEGLREGDVIIEIDRSPVKNAGEAIKLSRKIKADSVLLYIWSKGGKRYIVIKNDK